MISLTRLACLVAKLKQPVGRRVLPLCIPRLASTRQAKKAQRVTRFRFSFAIRHLVRRP